MKNHIDNNSKIRLIYITTGLNTGGAEIVLYHLIQNLPSYYQIHVISLSSIGEIGERIRNLGINVEALNINSSIPNPLSILKLYRLLKAIKPDIVNTWLYHADMIGGVVAKLAGIKTIIWSIHYSDVNSSNTSFKTRFIIKINSYLSYWIPSQVLFCSNMSRNTHKNIGYNHNIFTLIPNGFDTSHFYPDKEAYDSVRKELGLKNDVLLVGLIARFDTIKNHKGFLEAASYLNKMLPNVYFLLVGEDIDNSNRKLISWIDEFGLKEKVLLLGLRKDIPRLTAALNVATLTSWSEAFPTIIGEAMACEVPCVVTNVGDAKYLVDGCGFVVETGDMKAVANACYQLLSMPTDKRLSLGKSARTRIKFNFELKNISRMYDSFYQETILLSTQKSKTNF